jgi:hypothetical protein
MNEVHAIDVLRQEIVNCNLLVKALIQVLYIILTSNSTFMQIGKQMRIDVFTLLITPANGAAS